MNEILNMTINEMERLSFDCNCGCHHTFDMEHIAIGKDALLKLTDFVQPFRFTPILMISDHHTFKAAGERTIQLLENSGFDVESLCFETGEGILIPDESVIGSIMMEMLPETGLLICVGSGSLNDAVKYISARMKIPYIIVATAPSMDGYLSKGASLIREGRKLTFSGTLPYAFIGDIDIIKEAPMKLIQAGFGDVIGKWTCLADWYLAREIAGEPLCETCVSLVQTSIEKVIKHLKEIAKKEEEGLSYLMEALLLAGIAMAWMGNSRPASGSEHLLSHYWEMDALGKGALPELHGIRVGIATPIIAEIFQMMEDDIPDCALEMIPSREKIEDLLKLIDAPISPTDLGIDRKLFYDSLVEAWMVREHYSILQLATQKGCMEEIAEKITERIYG